MAERGWGYIDPETISEVSAITVLDQVVSLTSESALFQTPACRAVIVAQHGELINSEYNGRLPLTIDVAYKIARYTGARTGVWNSERAFDSSPNNHITLFRDINDTYMPDNVYDQLWSTGVIWARNVNRTTSFYPAFSTVYKDDTSVLRSMAFIIAICQVWKYAVFSWQQFTGNQKLTKPQIIARSNEYLNNAVAGKFDQRFDFDINTRFTEADIARGYSWTCDIGMKGNLMPTVGTYSIKVARRDGVTPTGSTNLL